MGWWNGGPDSIHTKSLRAACNREYPSTLSVVDASVSTSFSNAALKFQPVCGKDWQCDFSSAVFLGVIFFTRVTFKDLFALLHTHPKWNQMLQLFHYLLIA